MTDILANASCVAIGDRAILITGRPGSGKSSLALSLIDRGAVLVGDDAIVLTPAGNRLIAEPPPNTVGLLEVRNVGLITLTTTSAPLALVIDLDEDAERLPDLAATIAFFGHAVPKVALWPHSPIMALRAETALLLHGFA